MELRTRPAIERNLGRRRDTLSVCYIGAAQKISPNRFEPPPLGVEELSVRGFPEHCLS